MKKFILIICIAMGFHFSGNAQTLEDYFQIAAENNPGLLAKYKNFEAANIISSSQVQAKSVNHLRELLTQDHRYIFTLIHAFEKAAEKLGFSKNQSQDLIISTMLGSIYLMQETKKKPEELAIQIAVKGGTTEAGIKNLKNNNIDKIIYKTFMAAYNRAKILSKKY